MLKITLRRQPHRITLRLEGRLVGPWVGTLEQNWLATFRARDGRPIVVDLNEVSFVDPAGRDLLTRMCARGARLLATGLESGPMALEIARGAEQRRKAVMKGGEHGP
jgi:hypothetical protein